MPDISSINPFANVDVGGIGVWGSVAIIIVIAILIFGGIGFLIFLKQVRKNYWVRIHVFRLMGNVPTRVAIYHAREIPFGMAGDKLWKVAPAGMMKLKVIKWLPTGKIQTAPSEFWYYIRDDGEWINFTLQDISDIQRKAGVRFTQEDMRLQRLATERLLEQRLLNKTFWEKWGQTIMMIIFFMVIAVCMVLIFYQFGKLLDKFTQVEGIQLETSKILYKVFGENYGMNSSIGGTEGLIPVS